MMARAKIEMRVPSTRRKLFRFKVIRYPPEVSTIRVPVEKPVTKLGEKFKGLLTYPESPCIFDELKKSDRCEGLQS
jgi:hypothetical protein